MPHLTASTSAHLNTSSLFTSTDLIPPQLYLESRHIISPLLPPFSISSHFLLIIKKLVAKLWSRSTSLSFTMPNVTHLILLSFTLTSQQFISPTVPWSLPPCMSLCPPQPALTWNLTVYGFFVHEQHDTGWNICNHPTIFQSHGHRHYYEPVLLLSTVFSRLLFYCLFCILRLP